MLHFVTIADIAFDVCSLMTWRYPCRAQSECLGESRMHRLLKPSVAFLAAAVFGVLAMQSLHAQGSSSVQAAMAIPERGAISLRIEGDAAALHVEVRQTTIADVLSALESFNIRYRSSIGLDEVLDGTYAGSLGHVVARLLNGYNYATKRDGPRLEVTIFGKRGEFAVPAPIVIPVRRRPSD